MLVTIQQAPMRDLRWVKLVRDARRARGRVLVLVATLALICAGLTALLAAHGVLSRESARDYADTHPADALVLLDRVDERALAVARSHTQVAIAEASGMVRGWVSARSFWIPLQLFVIPDFASLKVNSVRPISGARAPGADEMLIDSGGLRLLGQREGARVRVRLPGGTGNPAAVGGAGGGGIADGEVLLAGVVHDAGIAPASIERKVTAYATPKLLSRLGQPAVLDRLKLLFRPDALAVSSVESLARGIARDLATQGYSIREIQIPPRGAHPHQLLNDSLLIVVIAFGLFGLVACSVLTGSLIGGMLDAQVREMGIMKAIGASAGDIAHMYLVFVASLATLSILIGVPLGVGAARALASALAGSLNVEFASLTAPVWTLLVPAGALVLTALHAAWTRIQLAARRSVRECFARTVAAEKSASLSGATVTTMRGRALPAGVQLGLRLAVRHRRALLSNASWVALGGGLFIGCFNVVASWNGLSAEVNTGRRYDAEIQFHRFASATAVASRIEQMPEIAMVESWPLVQVALAREEGLTISHTYPDGDHGQLYLRGATAPTALVHLPMSAGRGLLLTDRNAAVLNPRASALMNARPGDSIALMANGRRIELQVVGVVTEVLTGATVYASPDVTGPLTNSVLIRFRPGAELRSALLAVVARLESAGLPVRAAFTNADLEVGQRAHADVVSNGATLIGGFILIVATFGLSAALGSQVARQSWEIGVLRAIGAQDRDVISVLLTEALCAAMAGALLALPVAVLVTVALTLLIELATGLPMPVTISLSAPVIWSGAALLCAVLASIAPSMRARRITVREALVG